jgi:hypothetical protein
VKVRLFSELAAARARRRALLERSHRYAALALDPRIHARTRFFHAAHIVTRMLSYGRPTPFIADLSCDLETLNASFAQALFRKAPTGTLDHNTLHFIEVEQAHVARALRNTRERLARFPNFACESHRRALGFEIARAASHHPLRACVDAILPSRSHALADGTEGTVFLHRSFPRNGSNCE